jgi:nucleoside-diphosphate-sugar epimerase
MSRVVVIGATGHIGTYLVPRLVRGGHEVIAMSRGAREPYHASPQWGSAAAGVAGWFGREPELDFVDWAEFERQAGTEHAQATREHTVRSIAASINRARDVLGYAPRYSSLEALHEALAWLAAHGQADVGGQEF